MTDRRDRALDVLLEDGLAHVVDLVLLARDGSFEAHSNAGAVGFTSDGIVEWTRGRNPLERQDPGAFTPLGEELANARPGNDRNHYPFAYRSVAQLFADPRAPDLAVVHTPAHNWEERGGHRGEHGSLGVIQSRAPLILSGAGVRRLGPIAQAARMVDIAPTLATLLGIEPADGSLLRVQDGRALDQVQDRSRRPERVVVLLCDGANANVLYEMAESGECPNVASLAAEGTTFTHGCVASFPSVTLTNHTTAVTGAHPGHHGVLSNFYFDRSTGRQIVANSPDTWHLARDEISPAVETIFEAMTRSGAGFAAAVNEPADRGAGYATFDVVRAGEVRIGDGILPDPGGIPGATAAFVQSTRDYAWSTSADHLAVQQVASLWNGDAGTPRPRLVWVNLILPDSANHAGGPYAEIARAALRDTDRRIGRIIETLGDDRDGTAFLLFADHGSEESDPDCKGDFDQALARAGIGFRDEGYGFIYLDA